MYGKRDMKDIVGGSVQVVNVAGPIFTTMEYQDTSLSFRTSCKVLCIELQLTTSKH